MAIRGVLNIYAEDFQATEYQVKAAFLYNFTKLVEWPTNAFSSPSSPLVIGILGRDPFGVELDRILAGRSANGREIKAVRFSTIETATNCHILFISESERRRLDLIVAELKNRPVLTVSDSKGFVSVGMIEMIKTRDTVNLRINLDATDRSNLVLSSRLTRLDTTLRPATDTGTNSPAIKPKSDQ